MPIDPQALADELKAVTDNLNKQLSAIAEEQMEISRRLHARVHELERRLAALESQPHRTYRITPL